MEHPESGIYCVVFRRFAAIRETIRYQPLMSKGCECLQKATCFAVPTGCEQETGERDHTISSPVRKPGIAGNDSFPVRRKLQRLFARHAIGGICGASGDKLVCRRDKPGA